jgi:two-component system chemotaxis response regulator CheB
MLRLLVVDDSALMRKCLVGLFGPTGDFEVRTARNGAEALIELKTFKPDVITLDVNMPEMDGLTCLSHIMAQHPCPVVMVSSLTTKGALATFEALALGAVDFVAKPDGTISLNLDAVARELEIKVRAAVGSRVQRKAALPQAKDREPLAKPPPARAAAPGVVVIGVSTGGPQTLESILPRLPGDLPWPVVLAQHMPAAFTKSFAERLDRMCALNVVEVSRPVVIAPGTVYIARGDADMTLVRRPEGVMAAPRPSSSRYTWHPSVDALAASALEIFPPTSIIGVLLTGMGNDGAEAMTEIHRRGGRTIAESEKSCVVFGMPKELIKLGGASLVMDVERIAPQVAQWLR